MANGSSRPIEDIEIGDEVIATDLQSSRTRSKAVTAVIEGGGEKELVDVTVGAGSYPGRSTSLITATTDHPFWVPSRNSWIDAGDLQVGDTLRNLWGNQAKVTALHTRSVVTEVYNLTVDGFNTYYVAAGATSVLVHNQACSADRWSTEANLNGHYVDHGRKMGYDTRSEYEFAAVDLMCSCEGWRPGLMIKQDGDKMRVLDPATGEFGVLSPNGIVSYFIPDRPPIQYFRDQQGILIREG